MRQKTAIAVLTVLLLSPTIAMAKEIAVVYDPLLRPHVEAVKGVEAGVDHDVRRYQSRVNGSLSDERALVRRIASRSPDLVVAIGQEALAGVVEEAEGIPIVFCLAQPTPTILKKRLHLAGVSFAPDPRVLARLLDQLFPGPLRIGAVYDPSTSIPLMELARSAFAGSEKVFHAVPVDVSNRLIQLKSVLDRSDAYWMVPDETLRHSDSIRLLLKVAARHDIAIIGPSEKFVKAGVLLSLEPVSEEAGALAADLAERVLHGKALPDPAIQPVRKLRLFVNRHLARERHLKVPDDIGPEVLYVP